MPDELLVTEDGPVLMLTLNRPQVRNAVDGRLAHQIVDALNELDGEPRLRVGVLSGSGPGFCSGMDLDYFRRFGTPPDLLDLHREHGKPLVAAIEGFALGAGLQLALACDIIVAASTAKIGLPEAGVGLFPGGGTLYDLAKRTTPGLAMELALCSIPMSVDTLANRGLIDRVTHSGEALRVAVEMAQLIAGNAPLGVSASRQLVRASTRLPESVCREKERELLALVTGSADAVEGVEAFFQRRTPEWTGT